MPERPNGAVLKTVVREHPGFESQSLRSSGPTGAAADARLAPVPGAGTVRPGIGPVGAPPLRVAEEGDRELFTNP